MATMSMANRVPAAILSSPLHGLLSSKRLVVTIRATAEAVRDHDRVAEALTALVADYPPYGRWAHVGVGADGTPDAADVGAEVARGRVLVRVELPPEASP